MVLKLENIGLKRGDRWIFKGIDLTIEKGTITGIIGASGAGKTSLLSIMSGLLDVSEGKVSYNGMTLIGPSEKLVPGYEEVQLVNQDFALDIYHSVEENIREKVLHLPKEDQRALIDEMLEIVELTALRTQKAHLLSGGEQQRLALARALACEPDVLLLDEPFVHLDQRLKFGVIGYLKQLNEVRKTTIILVSHDGAEMMGVVDDIICLKDGKIDRRDFPKSIYYRPSNYEQGVLLGMLNRLIVNNDEVLFRPNEYTLDAQDISVSFIRAVDTGMMVYNYFRTVKNELVILSSSIEMNEVTAFGIKKRL